MSLADVRELIAGVSLHQQRNEITDRALGETRLGGLDSPGHLICRNVRVSATQAPLHLGDHDILTDLRHTPRVRHTAVKRNW